MFAIHFLAAYAVLTSLLLFGMIMHKIGYGEHDEAWIIGLWWILGVGACSLVFGAMFVQ